MPVCASACAAYSGGDCVAVHLELQVTAHVKQWLATFACEHTDQQGFITDEQVPAAFQNTTLDGRGGGSIDAVPLNYLHMVLVMITGASAALL